MSIIAISGVPSVCTILDVVKGVGRAVGGPFEPLNFVGGKGRTKTLFLRLSETMDAMRVVESINSTPIGAKKLLNIKARVPEYIPDLTLSKKKKIPMKLRNKLKIPQFLLPHEVLIATLEELFQEVQYKYPGLYNLSRKTGHKLLDKVAMIIADRLKAVMEAHPTTRDSCFRLSGVYRRMHPHFGDFQLLLSTLHRLQDAAGAPRTQVTEADLLALPNQPLFDGREELLKKTASRVSQRVEAALGKYFRSLDSTVSPGDDEEMVARKRIREEMKKIAQFLPQAMKQVIMNHLIPEEPPNMKIRIYGEPFLPNRETMSPFIRRYTAGQTRVVRSQRMYNLVIFRVPQSNYAKIRAMDSTVVSGAKLTIRSDIPIYNVNDNLCAKIAASYGAKYSNTRPQQEEDEEDQEEEQEEEGQEEFMEQDDELME